MDWTYLRPCLVRGTLAATVAAGLVAAVSRVPFPLALASLLFAWPIADLVIEWIASRVPGAERRVTVALPRSVLVVQLALWMIISGVVAIAFHQSVVNAAAVVLVSGAPIGGLLGILSGWEDSQPGGFHNPS